MLRLSPSALRHLPAFASVSLALAADPRGDNPAARPLPPAAELAQFHLPPGFAIQLVAAEPEIQKPLNLAFDSAGRVWVTGSTLYPWPARRDAAGELIATFEQQWTDTGLAFRSVAPPPPPSERGLDSIRVLSDFDPATGRARHVTTFADGLNIPVGVLPLPRAPGAKGDAVIVYSIPAIWLLTDTDGDGRADRREKLYDGFGFKDTHGMSSSYWLWFDGWVYGTHGFANHSEVRDRAGNVTVLDSGNTYRFRPDGSRFELVTRGQTNPFGLAFDARGDLYTADSHSKPVYLLVPGGYYEGISKGHDGLGFAPPITLDDHGSSAIAGLAHYSAAAFPAEYHGNLFNGNPVTRRVNRDRLDWRGSTPAAVRQPDFLTSDDPCFRPVQVKLGPDGALWLADFYNPIIGHYEFPLAHPARDHAHGRVWRIVWRGLDASVPPPALPNLASLAPPALVARLADPNLVVRSLAAAELLARPDAALAVPALRAAAEKLATAADPAADETAALPLLSVLDHLGALDPALLRHALARPDGDVALAALRVLATRPALPADAELLLADYAARVSAEKNLRALADLCRRQPQPWQVPLLLAALARAPESDPELAYALKISLKPHLAEADAPTLRRWADAEPDAARLAEISLAVATPAVAEFLLWRLERTKFADARAGDFARHAVQQLPAARLAELTPALRALDTAPLMQRVAFAEGLATVARLRPLPAEAAAWMDRVLLAGIVEPDYPVSLRAVRAVAGLALPGKIAALRRVATRSGAATLRDATLRATGPRTPEADAFLAATLADTTQQGLRRTAAEFLGGSDATPAAIAALAAAFPTANAELSLTIASALAKSEPGAAALLAAAAAGQLRAAVLRHHYVATPLAARSATVRERAAALTAGLPPEDARLDLVIAARVAASANFKPDPARGAALFATHCALCHTLRGAGGNIGPGLDGIATRGFQRVVEDILDPNRNVDPVFRLATVTLKNGETRSGMNLREQAATVLLADPATARDTAIPAAAIARIERTAQSPMPPVFETLLPEQDFFDLLAHVLAPAN